MSKVQLSRKPETREDSCLGRRTVKSPTHIAVNEIESIDFDIEDIFANYEEDKFYKPLLQVLNGERLSDPVNQKKFKSLASHFHRDGKRILYDRKLCVPKKTISDLLKMAHDSKISDYFGIFKTTSRLKKFYWKNKAQDVKRYVQGCLFCQQKKDHQGKRLGDPNALEIPNRRWGSLETDFIVALPRQIGLIDSQGEYTSVLPKKKILR